MTTSHDSLGSPAFQVAGLQLWVHGRQFPDSFDAWDGNWLNVSAHCQARGTSVWASGPLIMATDLARWLKQCRLLYESGDGDAKLQPLEPNLVVTLRTLDELGHLEMHVEITPHHMVQRHRVIFEIDQSYLPSLMRQCQSILEEYPVRGSAGAEVSAHLGNSATSDGSDLGSASQQLLRAGMGMRVAGALQLCLSIPLGSACLAGFARATSWTYDSLEYSFVALTVTSVVAGAGMVLGRVLGAYLAVLSNVVVLAGCLLYLSLSVYDQAQPYSATAMLMHDGLERESADRFLALVLSLTGTVAGAVLLWGVLMSLRTSHGLAQVDLLSKPLDPQRGEEPRSGAADG